MRISEDNMFSHIKNLNVNTNPEPWLGVSKIYLSHIRLKQ